MLCQVIVSIMRSFFVGPYGQATVIYLVWVTVTLAQRDLCLEGKEVLS